MTQSTPQQPLTDPVRVSLRRDVQFLLVEVDNNAATPWARSAAVRSGSSLRVVAACRDESTRDELQEMLCALGGIGDSWERARRALAMQRTRDLGSRSQGPEPKPLGVSIFDAGDTDQQEEK